MQRLETPLPPSVTATDAFFTFLFSQAPVKYDELKQTASAQEPLPSFRLAGVKLTSSHLHDFEYYGIVIT